MSRKASEYPLVTLPLFPGNGLPPRPGEDRPGMSPFGRLAMGQTLGKSSILIYDQSTGKAQHAPTDMISIEGDDLDAQQLIVTLHPPRVIPLCFGELILPRLDQQNLTGEQTNAEVTDENFPGTDAPIQWPPLEAVIEFGVGASTKVVVDYLNGATLAVEASFLRVSAVVTQSRGAIVGTSAAYHLVAHVGPGTATPHARRTLYMGSVPDAQESSVVLDVPRFAKHALLVGFHSAYTATPMRTTGWIRFWQSPNRTNGVGDFYLDRPQPVVVPNGAQYFTVVNESGEEQEMSVVFELAL